MSGNTLADAVASWRNGRRAQAEEICRALIAQDSRLVDAYRLLAEIFASSGRAEAALAACHRVAELAPADAPIWLMIGGLLLSSRLRDRQRRLKRTLRLTGLTRQSSSRGMRQMRPSGQYYFLAPAAVSEAAQIAGSARQRRG